MNKLILQGWNVEQKQEIDLDTLHSVCLKLSDGQCFYISQWDGEGGLSIEVKHTIHIRPLDSDTITVFDQQPKERKLGEEK